jgi:integrase
MRALNKLTAKAVSNHRVPGRYSDGGGLYLLVKPAGKYWMFRFRDRVTGKLRDHGLGPAWDVDLAEARERAAKCRKLLRDGMDPIDTKRRAITNAKLERARAVTFGECVRLCVAKSRGEWRNAKHAAQWTSTLNTYAGELNPLPVADIDTAMVRKVLEPIWESKTETATRLRQRIEKVLDYATAAELRAGDNPARWRGNLKELLAKPSKLKNVEHRAALPYAEMGAFMVELRRRNGVAARALELQILTATRPGEACGVLWAEIDTDAAVWIIPKDRMKAGKEHRVPLSEDALILLSKLPRTHKAVFPGMRGKPITTAATMKLLKQMRPGLTAHGFRSSFRDWAGETTSYPREVIEAAMAHRLKDAAEAAYARGDMLAKRARLMADWARYCAKPARDSSISPIRRNVRQ